MTLDAEISKFAYRKNEYQITDVRVSLPVGRTVLLGPNGAGKTTLLKLLAGVHSFAGSLDIDGVKINPRHVPAKYRTSVGWLPQQVTPFPALTLREHVAYTGWLKGMRTRDAWLAARVALDRVGLTAKENDKADRLSGGQTRRLGIASVLVHDARYLLLDEPTAGLDPRECERLLDVLRSIESDHAVLVSTHDTSTLIDASARIVVLDSGTVKFAGDYLSFIRPYADKSSGDPIRQAYSSYVAEE